jgi:hypothetical protein
LNDPLWDRIGWEGRECLNDSAHIFIYAQHTADNRIAIGGHGAPYRFGSGTGSDGATKDTTVRQLLGKLESFFPGVPFAAEHAWSGVLGLLVTGTAVSRGTATPAPDRRLAMRDTA